MATFETFTVDDLADLIQRTIDVPGQYGPVFRGHADMDWTLASVLFRARNQTGLGQTEKNLIQNFRNLAWSLVPDPESLSLGDWLAVGRHHQLPTRLLDWSESPLIAAWFAVTSLPKKDACVWMLKPDDQKDLHTVKKTSELDVSYPDSDVIRFDPPVMDPRFRSQLGLFTADSFQEDDGSPINYVPLEKHRPDSLQKFIIPASHKDGFRRKLSRLGIDAFTVFPDLDGLGQQLGHQNGY